MTRTFCLTFALGLVIAGLLFHLNPWGLSLFIRHAGGGFLWGSMVFVLTAAARPVGLTRSGAVMVSLMIAALVEDLRLYPPAFDVLGAVLPGQFLLGRILSPLNMLVDGAGVAAASAATWGLPWDLAAGSRI